MGHEHMLVDSDVSFVIDPISRSITNPLGDIVIGQHDHRSQMYTFEIPRYIDNHDMSAVDRIEIHFINITRNKKEQVSDVYIVSNDDILAEDNTLRFGWLVTSNSTSLIGSLNFSISFRCFNDDGFAIYEWSTGIYKSIQVKERYQNIPVVLDREPDLFETIKDDILEDIPESGVDVDYDKVHTIVDNYLVANPPYGDSAPVIKF